MGLNKPFTEKKEIRRKVNNLKGFKFDPKIHRYTLNGVELVSATSLIKRYEKPFEKIYISQKVANKNRNTGKGYLESDVLVRKYWSLLGEHASSLGTAGHAFCVMYWLDPETVPVTKLDMNAKKLMDALKGRYNIINMEVSRGNRKCMIGYTIDIEMQDRVTGEYVLGDFKFSKAFTSQQYKTLKGRLPGKMNPPFNNLRSIGLDKGKIQLNIYSKLYAQDTGRVPSYSLLFHIDGLSNYYGDKGYEIYIVEPMDDLIGCVLDSQTNVEILLDMI